MEKFKKWLEPTKNKVIAGFVTVAVIAAGGFGIWSLEQTKPIEPVIVFKENIVFEYGENLDQEQIIETIIDTEKSDYTKISGIINLDTANVTIKLDDHGSEDLSDKHKTPIKADKDGTEKEFEFAYDVKDTQSPVIEGAEDIETPFGSELKFEEFITGTDPVDGKTKLVVEGELDTSKAGQYEMKAVATDNNGNKTEKVFVVTVLEEEKEVEEPTTPTPETPSNTGGGTSSTNKPSTNGGGSSTKPSENPKPIEPSKPEEPSKPAEPSYLCPNGKDKNKPCDAYVDPVNGYLTYKTYSNMDLCKTDGKKVYDSLKKENIDGKDVVRYSCTEVGLNDTSKGSFYALRLIHNGDTGQWYLNPNKKWVQ
ncbi:DUF5011 domain-containing protein [Erysipelothrix sp. HDW6A]|uniref:DUF5011 domain-containing protein n=1 Tax=Erysipelothrix sp. HDW6A TaxID=2714928 RepID=UPI001407F67A|nr:DUF5011 domain-containing protein [Erysipelothrix sp. HDW6A]QIK57005.1 DUF5011 domain-containing protein [Erysipelothrix sp. HDW6A]